MSGSTPTAGCLPAADLDPAISAAFEAELARLPKGAQNTIRDAMSRDESLSWAMFLAGWNAGARRRVICADEAAQLFPRKWTTTRKTQ